MPDSNWSPQMPGESNVPDGVDTFDFNISTPQGLFTPFSDGHAIGFAFDQEGEKTQFIMLNPSGDSDDGQPNVFVYMGETGDVARDTPQHYYNIGKRTTPDSEADLDAIWDINDVTLPQGFRTNGDTGRPPEGTNYLMDLDHGTRAVDTLGVEFAVVGYGSVQGSVLLRGPEDRNFQASGDTILKPVTP